MTFIKEILAKHPEAGYWHQQYPWFSLGQLIYTANKKDATDFETAAQHTAVFFNNIPRLHWLLYQEDVDETVVLSYTQQKAEIVLPQPASNHQEDSNAEQLSVKIDLTPLAIHTEASQLAAPHFNIDLSAEPEEQEMNEDTMIEEEAPLSNSPLSQSLAQVAGSFKNNQPTEESILFETAYQHTIDYFASQGIKLEGEPAQDDRFGQQLKTFTSWLRQMKRLPNSPEQENDPIVETHAAHSLQKGDILTEPMVDVLLKQGKKAQAITLLEKLRLLYPEKSLYFAARIDHIKHLK